MSDTIKHNSPNAVCVLGMHRSGTSTMSGILNLLGFHIGRQSALMKPDEFNAKGYWEHQLLTDLNDEILSRLGGHSHMLPPFPSGWQLAPELEDIRRRARVLIEQEFSPHKSWSWKDPRNCLLIPFWQELLPPMRYIICLRNPIDVAKSLMRRDGFSFDKSVGLWLAYVKSAIVNSGNRPRIFVSYEDLMANPDEELRRIGSFLGVSELLELESTRRLIREFVDQKLCHHRAQLMDVINEPRIPYESKSFYTILQLSRNNLNASYGVNEVGKNLNNILNHLSECAFNANVELKDKATKVAELEGQLAGLQSQLAGLQSQLAGLQSQLAGLQDQNSRLKETVSSIEEWQKSWFRRVLHRWHPPRE